MVDLLWLSIIKTDVGVATTDLEELFEWLEERYGFDYVDIVEKFVDFQKLPAFIWGCL